MLANRLNRRDNVVLTIKAHTVLDGLKLGDSVAVNGPCLTVAEILKDEFKVEATKHTVDSSAIVDWNVGRKLNLERALKVGDRLGGHIVQGHVDGIGSVSKVRYGAGSTDIYIETAANVINLIVPKGSITVDGVSLTVAEKYKRGFKIMVVPFTLEHTTLGDLKPGGKVNLETDLILRWLADRFSVDEQPDYERFWRNNFNINTED